jgi:hypothetical protein
MVHAEAAFPKVPAVVGRPAIRLRKIVIELVGAIEAIIGVFA